MSAIWADCRGEAQPGMLSGTLWRLVESQEQIATTRLVDDLDEQAVLEELLESTKPPLPGRDTQHYLLRTPFRYPPLRHGSRFGARSEPSLLYGSLSIMTMLAESAFYRFLFWHGMRIAPTRAITSQHTAFSARYKTLDGLKLHAPPFDRHRQVLTHPSDYSETQALGAQMRASNVQAFEFISARDPDAGKNVALFTPKALSSRKPLITQRWVCQTSASKTSFLDEATHRVHDFDLELFLIAGSLPQAAI